MSLSELGRSRGLEATSRVLASRSGAATIDEAEAFGIAPGAELFELERVRMLDGLPISLDHNRVPLRLRCRSWPSSTSPRASLYDALERAGHPPARADYELEAARRRRATRPSCSGWRRARRSCSRRPSRSARTAGSWISGSTVYRADRYRFQATLMRRAPIRGRGRAAMRRPLAQRGRCRSRWRSPSPRAAGRRGRTSRRGRRPARRLTQVKTERLREARPGHAQRRLGRGLRRPARRDQGS